MSQGSTQPRVKVVGTDGVTQGDVNFDNEQAVHDADAIALLREVLNVLRQISVGIAALVDDDLSTAVGIEDE